MERSDVDNLTRDPEQRLLLCGARVCLEAHHQAEMASLLAQPLDWAKVWKLAHRHEVEPMLFAHLEEVCPDAVPDALRDPIRLYRLQLTTRNLYLTQQLLNVLQRLRQEGIEALPFKGSSLLALAYGHPSLRTFSDIDILVRSEVALRAWELLLAAGYRPVDERIATLSGLQRRVFFRTQCEVRMEHTKTGCQLELHWRFNTKPYCFDLTLEALQGRLIPSALGDETIPQLSPEDHLLVLCVHGARHGWLRLKWICDIAELLRRHPDLDWTQLFQQAQTYRAERRVRLGLDLAAQLLGASLPAEAQAQLAQDPALPALSARVHAALFSEEEESRFYALLLFYAATLERAFDPMRCLLTASLQSPVEDYAGSPLALPLLPFRFAWRACRQTLAMPSGYRAFLLKHFRQLR